MSAISFNLDLSQIWSSSDGLTLSLEHNAVRTYINVSKMYVMDTDKTVSETYIVGTR